MKHVIQKITNLFGYKISKLKLEDTMAIPLSFYDEIYGKEATKNKDFVNIGAGTFIIQHGQMLIYTVSGIKEISLILVGI